ncbi:MAG: hypothetical protein AAF108_01665 [Planctomycetota bacterium]
MDWLIERLNAAVTEPFQYYATDWLAVLCTGVYLWRLGDKQRDAFVWGGAGNVFFIAFNTQIESVPGIVFNAVFVCLNARAFLRWRASENEAPGPGGGR